MISVAEIHRRLVDGELLTPQLADEHVDRWKQESKTPDDSSRLIHWLIDRDVLTRLQGDALLAGHQAPFMLGPYLMFERLAHSQLGNVYRAVHVELDHPVSLKVFPRSITGDPGKLVRVQREARASVELDHPNLLKIFQIGRAGPIYYLASQALKGETLLDLIARESRLREKLACQIVRQAALGLQHLHEHGLIHRDVAPEYMWITEGGTVKVTGMDYLRDVEGTLGIDDEAETTRKLSIGSVPYMSPEQAGDPESADARSDVYSLGCVLYRCLTGRLPFPDRNAIQSISQNSNNISVPVTQFVPDLPETLVETLNQMLATVPDDRPWTMNDVASALEQQLDPSELEMAEEDTIPEELLLWLSSADLAAVDPEGDSNFFEHTDFVEWLAEDEDD